MKSTIALLLSTTLSYAQPAQYQHHYHGKLRIFSADQMNLRKACHSTDAAACARVGRGSCDIIIGQLAKGTWKWKALLEHELAHCNGWPANHQWR